MNTETILAGLAAVWANVLAFFPKFILFLVILVVGYFISKWIARLVEAVLKRVGFDRLVERGGIDRALAKSPYHASDILRKIVFFALFVLVLELAFSAFGPNPISDILTRLVAFLPMLFVSLLIVVIAAALAKGVKQIVAAMLGGVSYGPVLANLAGATVLIIGVFAALSHLQIAPAIVNGLFYAALAVVAGSAIVAIGGSGIRPMERMWEKALNKVEEEAPKLRAQTQGAGAMAQTEAQAMQEHATAEVQSAQAEQQQGTRFSQGEPPVVRYEPKERGRP
jgi:hypothetical protein